MPEGLGPVISVSAGSDASCAVTANGLVSCWGNAGNAAGRVPTCFALPPFASGEISNQDKSLGDSPSPHLHSSNYGGLAETVIDFRGLMESLEQEVFWIT